jgi:uncharacterized protein GlcG (DUF336 family)
MKALKIILGFILAASSSLLHAQAPALSYGPAISLADAKGILGSAAIEAKKNNWHVVIAIVDSGGHLVALERMDNTQFASIEIAQGKARTSVAFLRPSKVFQDGLAAGGDALRSLKIPDLFPIEGGLPIVRDGKVIGAIGVSGVTSAQDGRIAAAGISTIR